jgi:hypothetical protein
VRGVDPKRFHFQNAESFGTIHVSSHGRPSSKSPREFEPSMLDSISDADAIKGAMLVMKKSIFVFSTLSITAIDAGFMR